MCTYCVKKKSAHSSCLVFTTNIQDMWQKGKCMENEFFVIPALTCMLMVAPSLYSHWYKCCYAYNCLRLIVLVLSSLMKSHAKITEELPHSSIPANSTKTVLKNIFPLPLSLAFCLHKFDVFYTLNALTFYILTVSYMKFLFTLSILVETFKQ